MRLVLTESRNPPNRTAQTLRKEGRQKELQRIVFVPDRQHCNQVSQCYCALCTCSGGLLPQRGITPCLWSGGGTGKFLLILNAQRWEVVDRLMVTEHVAGID